MSDFLTQEELLYWVRFYAKKGMTPQLPAGYVLASPHDAQGVVAWRKLDAGYISTGVIDVLKLTGDYEVMLQFNMT
jgi:hypothetical protein